eukprot:2882615-Amphidinium_carterae.1
MHGTQREHYCQTKSSALTCAICSICHSSEHKREACTYTTRTATHTCGHQSDAFGHHAQSCCCGPRTVGHNRLCDKWASLCREAGWYVTTQQ